MRRAAARGHDVLFVETGDFIGKHLSRLVLGPGRRSLARRLFRGEPAQSGITVRKALNLLPWGQRYRLCDRANGAFNRFVVGRAARRLHAPRVAWLYDPRATWAIGGVGDAISVYDCVDDYAQQTGNDRSRRLVAKADGRAAAGVDLVFTTTRALRDRHLEANPATYLVGNVGDFAHFAAGADASSARPDLRDLPKPVLGFAGNILPGKLDPRLLETLADHFSRGTVVLAGPVDAGLAASVARLSARPNVASLGPVPYEELPRVVASFDVALIPYETNDYTRNVFPLKLFEYLAAGKPVVATGLPELEGMEPDVVVASEGELVAATTAALALVAPADVQRRQALAARNTWETRTERLLALAAETLEGAR